MATIRIAGGRVIDPRQSLDQVADLWIAEGRIAALTGTGQRAPDHLVADEVIDGRGLLVIPGLVDMHVHLREPGNEAAETIASGARAALESGITTLAAMPDTEPAVDNQAAAEFVTLQAKRAGTIHVRPIGAVTKGRAGEELAEMGGLVEGGAVAFSDGDRPIASAEIMRRALEYSQMFSKPVLSHPETVELVRGGVMNEGRVSVELGMAGMPAVAEEIMVDRDIHLARWTGGRLHLLNLSCAGSVEAVRRAKAAGLPITAEVCPHHLVLTDDEFRQFDSNFKVSPPLRTRADVDALIEGVADGTIDVVTSGHAPIAAEQKLRELDLAPFGVVGIETLFPIARKALVDSGRLDWLPLIGALTQRPARVLQIDRGTLAKGCVADVTLIDPDEEWTVDPDSFRSKSRNSPFAGWRVKGRAVTVLVAGSVRFNRRRSDERLKSASD